MLRRWRRRRILERRSIPEASWKATVAATPVLARLDPDSLHRLRQLTLLFLHEKRVEPAVGFALDEEMPVRIAALACLPILELGLDWYDGFRAVVVYPDSFVIRDREIEDDDGVVHIRDDELSGEAWERGPVILSWQDVRASGCGEGYNVVAHEFAHKLDLLTGEPDGTPPLHRGMRLTDWRVAFDEAYDDLLLQLERGQEPWIDPYAAEDPGEFFAVCAELFFDTPADLAVAEPAVYARLRDFFRQDPARSNPGSVSTA